MRNFVKYLFALIVLFGGAAGTGVSLSAQVIVDRYETLLELETRVANSPASTADDFRLVINRYWAFVRRYPATGYADNALWQAASLSSLAFERFAEDRDKHRTVQLLQWLRDQYPHSPLRAKASAQVDLLTAVEVEPVASQPESTIRSVRRDVLPEVVRITVELDREVSFYQERIEGPARLFFDLKGTRAVPTLVDATLRYDSDVVRHIRLGRHPNSTTRIVLDLENVPRYSVFTRYNPYRIVIDAERGRVSQEQTIAGKRVQPPTAPPPKPLSPAPVVTPPPQVAATTGVAPTPPPKPVATPPPAADLETPGTQHVRPPVPSTAGATVKPTGRPPTAAVTPTVVTPATAIARNAPVTPAAPVTAVEKPAGDKPAGSNAPVGSSPPAAASNSPGKPVTPSANTGGNFSVARQLGLGVSRIVIDAGHGGHDPGATAFGLAEADLVLDVALRLEKLLLQQPGMEVELTRRTNEFLSLDERTAIANRESADLFLSIHANASGNATAQGVETYFLNFALNPQAEAVAARENAASGKTMASLPDIIKAITMNSKLNESRDFAASVQRSLVRGLRPANRSLKDLGVKQAPFMVLIGAAMPSVLAEISFVTNAQDSRLLKTPAYRQKIAESLLAGVLRYQQSLKKVQTTASK
jgi:N-acetylmuramoyl-L-alanine amidase